MFTSLKSPLLVRSALLSLVFALPGVEAAQAQQLDPATKAIADAWAKRQAALKTVKIIWRQERTDPHAKVRLQGLARAKGADPGEITGPSETTYETIGTLCLDGDSVALTMDINDPRADALQTPASGIPLHTKDIFKGGESHHFNPARPGRPHGNAWFTPAKSFHNGDLPDIRPLMFALRPQAVQLGGIDLAAYRIADQRPTLNGVSCQLLEQIKDGGPQHRAKISFWVDPARDYLVLRSVITLEGRDFRTTDIVYEQNAAGAWIPSRWDVVDRLSRNANFDLAIHARRLKAIVGEPVSPTEFELGEFPLGTLIIDSRGGRRVESEVGKKPEK